MRSQPEPEHMLTSGDVRAVADAEGFGQQWLKRMLPLRSCSCPQSIILAVRLARHLGNEGIGCKAAVYERLQLPGRACGSAVQF